MILFAYAGNMDVHKFSEIVPSAKKIGIARLPSYSFTFNKTAEDQSSKANITPTASPDDVVWGVLIEFDAKERSNFYNPETWGSGLKLEPVICFDAGDQVYHAEAFVAEPHAINTHLLPYDWYHKKIQVIAQQAGLPVAYVNKISLMAFKTDPDEKRRTKRLKKLGK